MNISHKIDIVLWFFISLFMASCNDEDVMERIDPHSPQNIPSDTLSAVVQEVAQYGLPVVVVETINEEEPSGIEVTGPWGNQRGITATSKVPGRVYVVEGNDIVFESGFYEEKKSGMTIKIRGNWTSWASKKPFKIKLSVKDDMLSRGNSKYADRDWALIKEIELRTTVGFWVNELMGLQWTPAYKRVNLVFNNDYRGVYLLIESVERNADCRLNVDKQTGYIVEPNPLFWNEKTYIPTSGFRNYTFKYPDDDDVTPDQVRYIQSWINRLAQDLPPEGSGEKYDQLIDVDSWARWMIAHDILGTTDAAGSNIFVTKYDNTDTSKLRMGNMWDFDSVFEAVDRWANVHQADNFYFNSLFGELENEAFKQAYLKYWHQVENTIFPELLQRLSDFEQSVDAVAVDSSLAHDQIRWSTYHYRVHDACYVTRRWLNRRAEWLPNRMDSIESTLRSKGL